MKRYSRSDLLSSAIIDGAGNIINGIFESKYSKLFIEIPEMEYKRGLIFVADINELIKGETSSSFTFEKLIILL